MTELPHRHSIAYPIAYTRVCDWVNGVAGAKRPKPETLEIALRHANKLGDPFIIERIEEAYDVWETVDGTPTPRECLPTATPVALEVEREISEQIKVFSRPKIDKDEAIVFRTHNSSFPPPVPEREPTNPYSLEMLTEEEQADFEVDKLLSE